MTSVCTPVPSACLEDALAAKYDKDLGAGTSAVMNYTPKDQLVGIKVVSSIDRVFRDPDTISLKEPESDIAPQAYGVNILTNILGTWKDHGLRRGDWTYEVIVLSAGVAMLLKNLEVLKRAPLSLTDAQIAAVKTAQVALAKVMDQGLEVYICPLSATNLYTTGQLLESEKPFHQQLFDSRLKLISGGCSYTAQKQKEGYSFQPLF